MPTQELTVSDGSFDSKERVKQAVDIVDLVGSHIQLRRQGRNYVGLCPWHDDTRPSLQVNPERQSFKCWVCDIGGDVFSFVMKNEGVEFREALEMLADRAGIEIEKPGRRHFAPLQMSDVAPEEAGGGVPAGASSNHHDKRTLLQAMAWAEKQYQRCLLESPEADAARRYLQERGIAAESVERFHLGFSPLERDWILRQCSGRKEDSTAQMGTVPLSPRRAKVLESIGILARPTEGGSHYDRFRGRLLFAIHDAQGRPVGIGGRVLPELGSTSPAKYVNSPETPLFTKSKLLYGLDLARETVRKTRTVLVMEGYTDVIVAHQYGFTNAVAVLGTALGSEHIKILKRQADGIRIVLVLDGDEAGTKRTNEVLELFVAEQADLRILTLPEDLDPCDYLHKYGAEAFSQLLADKAIDALDHAFEAKTRGVDLERDVHQASQALEELIAIVAKAPRLRHDTTRDARFREEKILQRLAARFRIDEREVRQRLTALRRSAVKPRPVSAAESAGEDAGNSRQAAGKLLATLDPWERELTELLVARPECIEMARDRIGADQFTEGACRRIYETCLSLADQGVAPVFDRLMLEFDEPAMKSLLVDLDENATAKGWPEADAAALLEELIRTANRKEVERRRPAEIVTLREGRLDLDAQKEMLRAIVEREAAIHSERQGSSAPTDG
ncbi:MAG: DNA primase [Planctomycetaceae bacterium]|nr:DNA primase [Planctomycetaceae bacterium]